MGAGYAFGKAGCAAPGFRLRAVGAYGRYDYRGSLFLDNAAQPITFDGQDDFAAALIGYERQQSKRGAAIGPPQVTCGMRTKGGPGFVQLSRFIKRSQAWHELSLPARCALIELLDRYNGINDGMIGLGLRGLAAALKCSHGTALNALRELDDARLAHPITGGHWRGKRATEWRITFYRCDKTGELPFKDWKPRQVISHESTKGQPRKHKRSKCPATKPHIQKSSMNGSAKWLATKAHIEYTPPPEANEVPSRATAEAPPMQGEGEAGRRASVSQQPLEENLAVAAAVSRLIAVKRI